MPVLPATEQKFPRYFEEYLEFLRYLKIFIYLFIPQFLAEPLTVFSGTIVTKLWAKLEKES